MRPPRNGHDFAAVLAVARFRDRPSGSVPEVFLGSCGVVECGVGVRVQRVRRMQRRR